MKRKQLETVLIELEEAKKVVAHNRVESDHVEGVYIEAQRDYKALTGHYFPCREFREFHGMPVTVNELGGGRE